jgi:hypothetical protein
VILLIRREAISVRQKELVLAEMRFVRYDPALIHCARHRGNSKQDSIMDWVQSLPENKRRGSLPRCLLFVAEDRAAVANKLTALIDLPDVNVQPNDFWLPQGLPVISKEGHWDMSLTWEAKLGETVGLLCERRRDEIKKWWLAVPRNANTPNWDIASTCTIAEKPGLLLIESKAHEAELKPEAKTLAEHASDNSIKNHDQIGQAIREASAGLNQAMTGWNLSRDSHYQLANRFAWAWKIAEIGVPVVLIYLAFLGANEMSKPITDCADWSRIVFNHSRNVVPDAAWGRDIKVATAIIKPLIRVWKQDFRSSGL